MLPDLTAKRARAGLFAYFVLLGLVVGLWAAGLPSLSARLDLSAGELGAALLLVSAGALVSMLLAGPLVDRYSSRVVCWFSGPFSALVLLGPALAATYLQLCVLAVLFGVGIGISEVGINAHSVEVERRYGRPIISAFHGAWSLGGAAAGGLTAALLSLGVNGQALLVAGGILIPFLCIAPARVLLPAEPVEADGTPGAAAKGFPLGWGLIALLGLAAFAAHLSEGAAMDWTALHAKWILGAGPALAPLTFTVYAVAMTTVRLFGDPIRARLGPVRTIRLSGVLGTGGYLLVLASPLVPHALGLPLAWIGWAVTGIGLATVIPVIFSAVGAAGGAVGKALSQITAAGYTGLLMGPATLGFVADHTSLPVALIIPTVLAAVITLAGTPAIRALTTREPVKVQELIAE
ncbi:MFS transporter [Nonomuraea sp. NPDC050556]|uniref:MFS transporter n=1 Tax=Nonomuraea sp. NPDC050556 TaxID=3364369 RepID=UPI0037980A8D